MSQLQFRPMSTPIRQQQSSPARYTKGDESTISEPPTTVFRIWHQNNKPVGILNPAKVIKVLFGK